MAAKLEPHEDWTEAEQWAWARLKAGEIADFNEMLGETADPAKPEDWDDRRSLRRQFLEAIIEDPWRSAIHQKGIRVSGALVSGQEAISWDKVSVPWSILTRIIHQ